MGGMFGMFGMFMRFQRGIVFHQPLQYLCREPSRGIWAGPAGSKTGRPGSCQQA